MVVTVQWSDVGRDLDLWDLSRGLYSYLTTDAAEILYIGEVDGTTVRGRWNRSGKEGFWGDLEERGIGEHVVLVGEVLLDAGSRLTREFLADVESLLSKRIVPWGNIQSTRTRISRPGLRVRCEGDWPLQKREFLDIG